MLFCLTIPVFLLFGCYCKTRSFEISKSEELVNVEGWRVYPRVIDLQRCGKTTRVSCDLMMRFQMVDDALNSLPNGLIGVRCESLELVVNGIKFTRINPDSSFFVPELASQRKDAPVPLYRFSLAEMPVKTEASWPDIPDDVKQITMNAIISFRNEKTKAVQTKTVSYDLVATYKRTFLPSWLFGI